MSTLSRRDQGKAETRALIVAAARALFVERGYEAATTREVAERAGVGTGTVFKHFPDKAALLVGVLYRDIDEAVARGKATLPDEGLIDQLVHLARTLYGLYATQPNLYRPLIAQSMLETGPAGDEARTTTVQFLVDVAELVAKAQAKGEVRADLFPMVAAQAFFGQYLVCLFGSLVNDNFDPEEPALVLRVLLEASLRGWR
jgi:AcrR family transcriptional regulator